MESLLPFVLFALVASITPGPTNVLVLACASRHGLAAALPMVVGAAGGAASVLLLVGTGLARPLAAHPTVRLLMAAVGLAWLTVLAVLLWRAAPAVRRSDDGDRRGRLGVIATAGLQWVNPKAWMMALAATGVFAGKGWPITVLAGVFLLVALPCVLAWAGLGAGAARWIDGPRWMRRFNRGMALLLLLSAWAAAFW